MGQESRREYRRSPGQGNKDTTDGILWTRLCPRRPHPCSQEHQGDLDNWLATLARWHGGEEYIRRDGDIVHVICAECLCPLVKDGPPRLPDTFCYCSLGWMQEMFGVVAEKPVDVELVESIKRGGQECRFIIRL